MADIGRGGRGGSCPPGGGFGARRRFDGDAPASISSSRNPPARATPFDPREETPAEVVGLADVSPRPPHGGGGTPPLPNPPPLTDDPASPHPRDPSPAPPSDRTPCACRRAPNAPCPTGAVDGRADAPFPLLPTDPRPQRLKPRRPPAVSTSASNQSPSSPLSSSPSSKPKPKPPPSTLGSAARCVTSASTPRRAWVRSGSSSGLPSRSTRSSRVQ